MVSSLSPLRGRFDGRGRLERLGLGLAAQPEAVALEVVDLPVVEQPIDEGRGERGVMQDPSPFGQAFVGRDSVESRCQSPSRR